MNLPNALTMVRFVLIPVFLALFFFGERFAAFGIWLLAGLTDILDGYLARKHNMVTSVGMMLDPLADKLMMLTVMLSLLWAGDLSIAAALAMLVRDAGMIAGAALMHFKGKRTVPANWMGKLTTVLYYIAILFIYFQWPHAHAILWGVILFSFVTTFMYLVLVIRVNRKSEA
ncbi:CDP-alcohol phosphatidyltransferase family protein [Paenibacillus thiaminolyticus]|uniref:CDP-alcohol phosphatidyltransferase family protein n=1 Tax=Paenibacillus thiaminolyticus TaxID=49283 RepID=UPI0011623E2A|nr:CDP-alcohol phosphatidyltransferase family protein [Paenibacillus thiaminolyticus]MDG0873541.1 CDP-alcohol phosphatidyltransferase family protein [Paenibacillus thiaminolyticus]NGP60157.1 CDP-diacylglycerol--glycerol-3-phosphate 3-phosphatidyltransferase [Paenibacillus thiaminolyticus]WCR26199.1 CDP-alcohol phosphatidyltransferase family protein [Paenibacillus thiaminolyticus]